MADCNTPPDQVAPGPATLAAATDIELAEDLVRRDIARGLGADVHSALCQIVGDDADIYERPNWGALNAVEVDAIAARIRWRHLDDVLMLLERAVPAFAGLTDLVLEARK
ncbi:MAG: hypothetical protein JNM13_15235 [Hyphomicrobiaceae bacterium]|nr:hypothetical protein [Hyphomicrobiaceae bacterium]